MEIGEYLKVLPEFEFAIAYGSGVFKQVGYSQKDQANAMIDVLIGVQDPLQWHYVNMNLNEDHYSFYRHLGSKLITRIGSVGYGHVYYNRAEVTVNSVTRPMKYGIISVHDLSNDLKNWDSLYVAGRLQKPVRILKATPEIIQDMNVNLEKAVLTVLPLLPRSFTDYELFLAISGLSYNGDIRTYFAENPHKVRNIVDGNYSNFKQLYGPVLEKCKWVRKEGDLYIQTLSFVQLASIASTLPSSLHQFIRKEFEFENHAVNIDSIPTAELYNVYYKRMKALYDPWDVNSNLPYAKAALAKGISLGVRHAVYRSSIDQLWRGLVSFGILKSTAYASKKVMKFLK